MKYGFYSKQAADKYGSVCWLTPDGSEIQITSAENDIHGSGCLWPDKAYVGPVVRYSSGCLNLEFPKLEFPWLGAHTDT